MDDQAIYEGYRERMRLLEMPAASFEGYMKATNTIPTLSGFTERQHRRFFRGRQSDQPEAAGHPISHWAGMALLGLVLFCGMFAGAQVTVNAQLVDDSGSTTPSGFLHFELENCGNNFPSLAPNPGLSQNPWTIVRTAFDIKPSQADGSILGQVLGNDQILCGNVASTYYQVYAFKDATTPVAPVSGQPYVICTTLAPSTMPCSNPGGLEAPGGPVGWNPALQQPSFQPVPPGLVQMYGNSTLTQVWNQPAGTQLTGFGTFDYTTGIEVGPVTFSQLAGLGGQVSAGTVVTAGTGCVAGNLIIGAPNLPGGVQAVGTYTCSGGGLAAVFISVPGSGYTSAPAASITTGSGTFTLNWLGFSNFVYVKDGSATNPCSGGGTGAFAFWVNGAWNCAGGGAGPGGTPGGSPSQLQFNNAGAFGGASGLTTDGVGTISFHNSGFAVNAAVNSSGILQFTAGAGTLLGIESYSIGLLPGTSGDIYCHHGLLICYYADTSTNHLANSPSEAIQFASDLSLNTDIFTSIRSDFNQAIEISSGATPGSGRGVVRVIPGVFSGLTGCASGLDGSHAAVTDSTTAVAGATITGGGSNHVSAYCNGTNWVVAGSSGSGSGVSTPRLENPVPKDGNASYTVSPTTFGLGHWEFVFGTTTYVTYMVYCPSSRTGDTIAVDVWSSDSTAGHTALITEADGVINSGTMNLGSLTSSSNQTFTTTSTAYNRVTLTFTVNSTISAGSILLVNIGTTPTGTNPTANIAIWPHFL